MQASIRLCVMASLWSVAGIGGVPCEATAQDAAAVELPAGVQAVWNLDQAQRTSTSTREQVCINGLWRWQPAPEDAQTVPSTGWGYFKVPGGWPGITDYMQKDCQTVFRHPNTQDKDVSTTKAAWYQRKVTIPTAWTGRRIVLQAEYVNSFATVFIDGQSVGEIRYPGGDVDVTSVCRPGQEHVLSMLVVAMPLQGVMLSYRDTASARKIEGRVERRGLCGDVFLSSMPPGPRIRDVKVVTSVRQWSISVEAAFDDLADNAPFTLQATITDGERTVQEFTGAPFHKGDLTKGHTALNAPWRPEKLWDIHTPQNVFQLQLSLKQADGRVLDVGLPVRFGFREFWIAGRDFYLNGTRIFLSSVPLDNAQVGAAWATYDGARESMQRLASFGINFVYTHNYGCEPGSHLGFEAILRAADDVGMLVAFSQPHFAHYAWEGADADQANGYAQHAAFYVRAAQNHPSVVAYSTSHNATGYGEDMNPDMIDGLQDRRNEWSVRNVQQALRAEAIIHSLDSSRIVYHHASGNLGSMHTSNFYANFAPVQEMSDWFEHWSTRGVKPLFTCEYSVPMPWDWAMYRGWYQDRREFGSAKVPWEFCVAEWNAQFFGDHAYQISDEEKANLRWEARQYQADKLWHRWDYPHQVGSSDFAERYPVYAKYFADNWPAFRAWEVSANSPWNHAHYWTLRPGVDKGRKQLPVEWANLQRPGFSPDYVESRYETIDLSYEREDWIPTVAAQALVRNNRPLLAFIAGKPAAFTSKDHDFYPADIVEKQLIVINNSRQTVRCKCEWTLLLPQPVTGHQVVEVATGQQARTALRFELPDPLAPGRYELRAVFQFSTGEVQEGIFSIDVVSRPTPPQMAANVALFDPHGETRQLLQDMGVRCADVGAESDMSPYDVLVVGKNALTVDGPAPEITRVRDGLKVILFEQTPDVLEKRFGLRVAAYGLRQVFRRVPEHAALNGIGEQHLENWRGAATILPPRLEYLPVSRFSDAPTVRWCGIPVSRLWRCGNRGNVASVLIEKPARGDFLPILDGGYSLQYSPLMEYREGQGLVLFCQLDVTGRTERDPVAETLVRNLLVYVSGWQPTPRRSVVYVGDPAWQSHLESAGISATPYQTGALAQDKILVVGPGGGQPLAQDAAAVADWLKAGGRVLALGLDEQEANAFLPRPVKTQRAEHIASYFGPPSAASPLAGIGPADIHNPAPREFPLLRAGATVVGAGMLGVSDDTQVVFCQLPPDRVQRESGSEPWLLPHGKERRNLKRTYRRTSYLITRLLGNLGVSGSTPLLTRFSTPVAMDEGTSVLKNGSFGADADADGVPDEWVFSPSPNAACRREKMPTDVDAWAVVLACPQGKNGQPTSTMLAQHEVPVRQGQWYRISLQARAERLAGGSVIMTIANTEVWKSFFDYQRFEPGSQWKRFNFEVQSNGTADRHTRFQIWYEGGGELWLSDVRMVPIPDPAVGRWLEGFYLDVPAEWDDPYRFFRW